jgi:hypothetical protein
MVRCVFSSIVAAASCLVLAASAPAQTLPTVRISAWEESANGTGVVFKSLNPTEIADSGIELPNQTAAGAFAYGVDIKDLGWASDCRCFRYIIITVKSRSGQLTRHKIKQHPSGTFHDKNVQVKLTISDGTVSDHDDISLPIASAPGVGPLPKLTIQHREPLAAVTLGGETEILLTVQNHNAESAMIVPAELTVDSDHPRLWRTPPAIVGATFPLSVPPGARQTIRLRLEPDPWQAVRASFVPSSNDKPHTVIRLRWAHANPLFNQREMVSDTELPIRFHPSVFALLAALIGGVLLGSVVLYLRQRTMPFRNWSRAAVTALAASLVLELIAVFLVANNSKFVIFNFDLDPWQTLPVVLLGIGNGLLGVHAVALLKTRFPKTEQS